MQTADQLYELCMLRFRKMELHRPDCGCEMCDVLRILMDSLDLKTRLETVRRAHDDFDLSEYGDEDEYADQNGTE